MEELMSCSCVIVLLLFEGQKIKSKEKLTESVDPKSSIQYTVNQQILACYYIWWTWRIVYFRKYLSPPTYVSRTSIVHCIDGETPNLIATKSLYFEKRQIL